MHHLVSVLEKSSFHLSLGQLINHCSTLTFWPGLGFKQETVRVTGFRYIIIVHQFIGQAQQLLYFKNTFDQQLTV